MQISARDGALLIVLSILWGGSFFFTAIAVREIPPFTMVLCRVALAMAALAVFLRIKGVSISGSLPGGGRIVVAFLIMGLINNCIPFSLLFWAQTSISSGLASILNATTPIFSVLAAHVALADEKMGPAKLTGVLIGIGGVAVLVGPDALTSSSNAVLGMMACLGAALSYGIASVFGRRFQRHGIPFAVVAFGQLSATTVLMLPVALIIDQPWALPLPSTPALLSIIALALGSTALAYIIYFRILAAAGAVNISLVTLLVPVSAILLGAVFLDEQLARHHFAGMALIALGLVTLDGRVWRRLRPAAPTG